MNTTTNKNLENPRVYLKLDSRIEPIEIKKNSFGYQTKKYLNDFEKQIKTSPECFLEMDSIVPEPVEFQTKTNPHSKRTVFRGYLKPGRAAKLGVKFQIVLSEVWHESSKTYSYPVTIDYSPMEKKEVDENVKKLFDKPGKGKKRGKAA